MIVPPSIEGELHRETENNNSLDKLICFSVQFIIDRYEDWIYLQYYSKYDKNPVSGNSSKDISMFKRILVPLDGSDNAEKVLPTVIREAGYHNATVVLLRVIAPLRQSLMASPSVIDKAFVQLAEIAKDYLEGIGERLQKEGLEVEVIVEQGYPAQWALNTAKDQECDLLIIGTHGETGSEEWRFGSVANKIIKAKLHIPMLVIPTN
jgi:nucleotide-binding universal stress UspA family protein